MYTCTARVQVPEIIVLYHDFAFLTLFSTSVLSEPFSKPLLDRSCK
jgi:hypothetical protein